MFLAFNFIKEETPVQVFSGEFCKLFKTSFFQENTFDGCFCMVTGFLRVLQLFTKTIHITDIVQVASLIGRFPRPLCQLCREIYVKSLGTRLINSFPQQKYTQIHIRISYLGTWIKNHILKLPNLLNYWCSDQTYCTNDAQFHLTRILKYLEILDAARSPYSVVQLHRF